ncbi:MAG: tetraacyldisaccharide 4'-kinase [Desulfobulbaceae bacterium]|nr:tetraacyldisaccharide 4'-kinase [Desulfobulbaceae bacterium]
MKFAKEAVFQIGRPLGPLYGGLMRLRASAYRRGWLRSERLEVPVVSIGNLTMGGTGKTPMVIQVVRLLQALGRKPAVVSRGYGGQARAPVNVVSDGNRILLDTAAAGDEPRLLAESLPGVAVVTGVRRALAARYAIERLGAEVIVLDDGFQHLALHRDLDLVLFKGPAFLGNGRIFPGGDLREPFSALGRASAFVLTDVAPPLAPGSAGFRNQLASAFPGRPIYSASYLAGALLPANALAVTREGGVGPCLAFCGLARPESFRDSLAGRVELQGFRAFADHHPYTANDLDGLVRQAGQLGAGALLTTVKDLVKLRAFNSPLPLYVLPVELVLPGEFAELFTGLV